MCNLKLPAFPVTLTKAAHFNGIAAEDGFTKLEYASLMIAQGLVAKYNLKEPADQRIIALLSVELATEILNETSK
jgi:hypothetical protein